MKDPVMSAFSFKENRGCPALHVYLLEPSEWFRQQGQEHDRCTTVIRLAACKLLEFHARDEQGIPYLNPALVFIRFACPYAHTAHGKLQASGHCFFTYTSRSDGKLRFHPALPLQQEYFDLKSQSEHDVVPWIFFTVCLPLFHSCGWCLPEFQKHHEFQNLYWLNKTIKSNCQSVGSGHVSVSLFMKTKSIPRSPTS